MAFHGFLPGVHGIKKYPGYTYLPLKLGTGEDAIFIEQDTLPIPQPSPLPPNRELTFQTRPRYQGLHTGEVRMIMGGTYWLWSDRLGKKVPARVGDFGVETKDLDFLNIGSRVSFDVISKKRKKKLMLYADDVRWEPEELEEIVDSEPGDMEIDEGEVYKIVEAEIKDGEVDSGKGEGKGKEAFQFVQEKEKGG